MSLRVTRTHFVNHDPDVRAKISLEVELVRRSGSGKSTIPLSQEGISYLSRMHPPVLNLGDLDTLAQRLKKGNEFGFSPIFDPALVDACCERGIFPLTLSIGSGYFIFAPKLHTERSLCALADSPEGLRSIKRFPFSDTMEGVFQQQKIPVSKKLSREPSDENHQTAFEVFVNRKEDWTDALTLLTEQHGENWLCTYLRKCFYKMFLSPEDFRTKVMLIVVRRHKYENAESPGRDVNLICEGDIVSAELGYIVGDVYTSATGGYCLDGAGSLQLAITGEILKRMGCQVWDLGMKMDYKKDLLGCVEISRNQWLRLMKEHMDNNIFSSSPAKSLLADLNNGCPVTLFLNTNKNEGQIPNPESKAQRKKLQKIEYARERKHKKRQHDEDEKQKR